MSSTSRSNSRLPPLSPSASQSSKSRRPSQTAKRSPKKKTTPKKKPHSKSTKKTTRRTITVPPPQPEPTVSANELFARIDQQNRLLDETEHRVRALGSRLRQHHIAASSSHAIGVVSVSTCHSEDFSVDKDLRTGFEDPLEKGATGEDEAGGWRDNYDGWSSHVREDFIYGGESRMYEGEGSDYF